MQRTTYYKSPYGAALDNYARETGLKFSELVAICIESALFPERVTPDALRCKILVDLRRECMAVKSLYNAEYGRAWSNGTKKNRENIPESSCGDGKAGD